MDVDKIRWNFEREKKIIEEISGLYEELKNSRNPEERGIIFSQIELLGNSLRNASESEINESAGIIVPLYLLFFKFSWKLSGNSFFFRVYFLFS